MYFTHKRILVVIVRATYSVCPIRSYQNFSSFLHRAKQWKPFRDGWNTRPTPSTNAHKLTTVTVILLLEVPATATNERFYLMAPAVVTRGRRIFASSSLLRLLCCSWQRAINAKPPFFPPHLVALGLRCRVFFLFIFFSFSFPAPVL